MATSVSGAGSKPLWRHDIGWRHDSRTCSTMTSYFSRRFFLQFLAKRVDLFFFTTWLCEQHSHIVWMVPCQVNRFFIIQYITRQNHINLTPTKTSLTSADLLGVRILYNLHPAVFVDIQFNNNYAYPGVNMHLLRPVYPSLLIVKPLIYMYMYIQAYELIGSV